MLTTALVALSLAQLPSVQDFIDNTEIGDAKQYIGLRSRGVYEGHAVDKAKGDTVVNGTWTLTGDTVEVKSASCKGPACKELKKDWTAKVAVAAARAMLVESSAPPPLFPAGAYYCHYLGCEPRLGVEIISKGASLKALQAVEDALIARNVGRNTTVVWIGPRPEGDTATSRIELCGRDGEKAKAALETLKGDLSSADWFGEVSVVEAPAKGCSWDVRLFVRDDIAPPAKKKKK
jgi:hypothetical protein